MNKTGILALAAAVLLSSCYSDRQTAGAFSGAMLGSIFGSSIGGIIGGPQGSDVGTLIGMAGGVAVGSAVTAPRSSSSSYGSSDDYQYSAPSSSTYAPSYQGGDRESAYSHEPERYSTQRQQSEARSSYDGAANIEIVNLRFVDKDKDKNIGSGESCQIIFNLKNNGTERAYDIAPVLTTDNKRVRISPTAIVESISAGGEVRYTAHVYADKRLKTEPVNFTLQVQQGNRIVAQRDFTLQGVRLK